jgi:hypothetical protein
MTLIRFRRTQIVQALGLLASLGAGGCSGAPTCSSGAGAAMDVFTLYFGKAIVGRADLTEREWQGFLDDSITANLPHGYTTLEGHGAWMNPLTHKTTKEATEIVVAALPASPESLAAINRIRTDYQVRFHQQAVGMTVAPACGSF